MHSHIYFFDELAQQQALIAQLSQAQPLPNLAAFIDGRQLNCPLPLLKTKIALKRLAIQETLYVVASDKNASHDIAIFCQKHNLDLKSWHSNTSAPTDTLFHFLITKKT